MKIAIDISQIVHEGTGVGTYTKELVKNLLAIDNANDYLLFGVSLRKKHILDDFYAELRKKYSRVSARFFSVPPTIASTLWNDIHKISLNMLIGSVDIFHSSDWIQPPIRAKKVTTIHDMIVYTYPQTSHPDIIKTQKIRLSHVGHECDAIIADSNSTKADIETYLHIDPSLISVVYLGIDPVFQPSPEQSIQTLREKYRLPEQFILTIGTQEPRKNIARLIEAKQLLRSHNVELLLVGRYGWGDKIDTGLGIRSLGYVPDADIPALYSAASVFVYPSLYEGFGLPVLEAMSCGTPVVTTNRGSLKEIADDKAELCDPEDAHDIARSISKLLKDSSLRITRSKDGILYAKTFTWRETAKKTLKIYESLVQ